MMISRKLGPKRNALLLLTLSFFIYSSLSAQTRPHLDINQIENLTGVKGEFDRESGIIKITLPHNELKVNSIGVKLTPALGLTSGVSFKPIESEVEVTGNLILFEDQVNPVMKEALENGFNIAALHNYYLWDSPRLMTLHIEGKGTVQNLAASVGKVFETLKKTRNGSAWNLAHSILDTDKSTLKSETIDALLKTKGILTDGVYKVIWNKTNQIERDTWAVFSGTDRQAVLMGDFAVKEDEAQNVLKVLLKHNIFIISLHQNRIGEGSADVGIHYMGRGSLTDLSTALKEALDCIQPTNL